MYFDILEFRLLRGKNRNNNLLLITNNTEYEYLIKTCQFNTFILLIRTFIIGITSLLRRFINYTHFTRRNSITLNAVS